MINNDETPFSLRAPHVMKGESSTPGIGDGVATKEYPLTWGVSSAATSRPSTSIFPVFACALAAAALAMAMACFPSSNGLISKRVLVWICAESGGSKD